MFGPQSAHLHSQPESQVGPDVERNGSGRPAPAPFWAVLDVGSDRVREMESMYARLAYARGGSGSIRHQRVGAGAVVPPSIARPWPHAECVHSHAPMVSFLGFPDHAPQARRFSDTTLAVRQLERQGPFRGDPDPRGDSQDLGNVDVTTHRIAELPTLGFTLSSQTWEEMAGTAFEHCRLSPPAHVYSGERSGPEPIQPLSFIGSNDTALVEVAYPREHEDEDEEACTLLCEWTDERGTCNMDVLGDRAWMRDHLNWHHHVSGNDKSQHACLWQGCTDTMSKGSLARHVVSRHLRAGASCGFCSKVYSRADVARRHTKKCKVANGASVPHDRTKLKSG